MLGLYLHIPFCSSICNYCNFNRGLFDDGAEDALRRRAASRRSARRRPTASAAPTRSSSAAARRRCSSRRGRRASSQACRDRVRPRAGRRDHARDQSRDRRSPTRLERFRAAGVNRISFGVQSFQDDELQRLGPDPLGRPRARGASREARGGGVRQRQPRPDDVAAGADARRRGCENVDALIEVGPDHASLYLLELYPNAPLKEDMARAGWSLAPDDDAAEMYLAGLERLDARRATSSTRSRTSRGPGASRATTSSTGPTASGSGSAAARTRRATASGGRTSSATEDYIDARRRAAADLVGRAPRADRRTSGWRRRSSPACG